MHKSKKHGEFGNPNSFIKLNNSLKTVLKFRTCEIDKKHKHKNFYSFVAIRLA